MIGYRIKPEGFKEFQAAMRKSPTIMRRHLHKAMDRTVKTIQRRAQVYPPPPPKGHWAALTTRAQKAAFFAQLREGGWHGRTGTLGRKWTTTVSPIVAGVRGVVQNPTPYGPHVQGDEQAAFHHGRWKPLSRIARDAEKDAHRFFNAEITEAVKEIEARAS